MIALCFMAVFSLMFRQNDTQDPGAAVGTVGSLSLGDNPILGADCSVKGEVVPLTVSQGASWLLVLQPPHELGKRVTGAPKFPAKHGLGRASILRRGWVFPLFT